MLRLLSRRVVGVLCVVFLSLGLNTCVDCDQQRSDRDTCSALSLLAYANCLNTGTSSSCFSTLLAGLILCDTGVDSVCDTDGDE
ncbi:MAG: hypothetical protein H7A22_11575 [Spirochaetales bacterium]|nr:hypothetical protein [Spirochaetales bacterium]